MSDVTPVGGGLALPQAGMEMPEGLEDMTASDITTPRIQIDHKRAVFVDSQSGEDIEKLENVIFLGLAKQRVLWPATIGSDKQNPMCKSFDAKTGHANPATFPWKSTAFDPTQYNKEQEGTDFERILLPCADCSLIVWDTHPNRETPWCTLQNTVIFMMNFDGVWMPALISFQRSGLKVCNTYLSTFARSGKPTYTAFTTVELEAARRGDNDYAVPKFTKQQATDPAHYSWFSQTLREVKDYLTASLRSEGTDGSETPVTVNSTVDSEQLPQGIPEAADASNEAISEPATPAPELAPAAPVPPAAQPTPIPSVPAPAPSLAPAPTPAPAPASAPAPAPQPSPAPSPEPAVASVPAGNSEPDDLPF